RAGDTDGNPNTDPDPAWTPLITPPCFPSYPSAHASGSYAARTIAGRIFGNGGHDITLSHPGIPGVTLHYTKFSQMTHDIDDARVYGGIHFRFDQEAGALMGRSVGSYVYNHTPPLQPRQRRLRRRPVAQRDERASDEFDPPPTSASDSCSSSAFTVWNFHPLHLP